MTYYAKITLDLNTETKNHYINLDAYGDNAATGVARIQQEINTRRNDDMFYEAEGAVFINPYKVATVELVEKDGEEVPQPE